MSRFWITLTLTLCGAAKPPQPITACLFTPDSSAIVIAHHNSVIVRSVADGREQRVFDVKLKRITALAFDPKGKLLAIAGGVPGTSGSVLLCDWQTNAPISQVGEFKDIATAVAFSPDGRRLAAASADKSAQLFDVGQQLEASATLSGHAGPVQAIAFSPDASTIITASADRSLKLWDSKSAKLIRTFTNHTDVVHCLAIRPGEQSPWAAASAGDDKSVRVWQPGIGRMVRIIRKHEGAIFAIAYTPGGSRLFSAGTEGIVRVIDADSDQILSEFKAHDDWVYSLAVSPDGKRLATGDWKGALKLWDVSGKAPRPMW